MLAMGIDEFGAQLPVWHLKSGLEHSNPSAQPNWSVFLSNIVKKSSA